MKVTAEDFPPDTPVQVFEHWDTNHKATGTDAITVRRTRNGYVTVRELRYHTTWDVSPSQLEKRAR